MKKLTATLLLAVAMASAASAQRAGDKIQIEHNGTWYDGTIKKVNGDQYFVGYDGWSDSWDEWVGPDRLKGLKREAAPATGGVTGKFKIGDRVEVEYGMIPAPARVIEVGENKYHIEFDNSLYKTKWVTEREIKKL